MNKAFQRIGAESNAQAGRNFELRAQEYFQSKGLVLDRPYNVNVGIESIYKTHSFDLGSHHPKVIVECKSHTWTKGNNVPSAKITIWNEAMYYFVAVPSDYRKIMFVLRDYSKKHDETLAEYYLRTYRHLIPSDVEFYEYDEKNQSAFKFKI